MCSRRREEAKGVGEAVEVECVIHMRKVGGEGGRGGERAFSTLRVIPCLSQE